ncbi:MAG TPA: hypothetical protein VMU18_05905 [Rhodoblastus sp.]|nr:hypothetical protein [Rhodoblastus sp.]
MIVPFPAPAVPESDPINFGDLSPEINDLLQKGVIAYRRDFTAAEKFFREALDTNPEELPTYFCLYKIHTYHGNLDEARAAAQTGMLKAARQAGWPDDWREWTPQATPQGEIPDGPARFALYTLKALAFISLRRDEKAAAEEILTALRQLDPSGAVGWPVIAELAAGLGR